jgi:hypothetical protein
MDEPPFFTEEEEYGSRSSFRRWSNCSSGNYFQSDVPEISFRQKVIFITKHFPLKNPVSAGFFLPFSLRPG